MWQARHPDEFRYHHHHRSVTKLRRLSTGQPATAKHGAASAAVEATRGQHRTMKRVNYCNNNRGEGDTRSKDITTVGGRERELERERARERESALGAAVS